MISAAPGGQTYVAWARTPFDPPGPTEFHVAQAAPGAAFAEQAYPAGAEAVALTALSNGHGLIASVAGGVAVRELTPGAAAPAPDPVSTGGTEPRLAAAGKHAIVVWLRGGRLRYAVRMTGGAR